MNLFEKHSGVNEAATKKAIGMIINKNVGRYILAQKELNELLCAGKFSKKCKPKKRCNLCKAEFILKDMAEFQSITREACKTYKLLFNEDFDLALLTSMIKKEFYPTRFEKKDVKMDRSKPYIVPDNAPEEVRRMCDMIQKAMDESGVEGVQMEVINIAGNNYGLNIDDFDNPAEFFQAVSALRDREFEMENEGKSGEEMLTDAVINKAEKEVSKPSVKTKAEKLN
jgi:hypothetical protein